MLKRKYRTLLIILLLIYPVYKGSRELFWVHHASYTINNSLKIKLSVDPGLMGFQDTDYDKTITIKNIITKAAVKISYTSIESNLYFYVDSINNKKQLSIIDQFAGKNIYDYSTLKLISAADCFKEFGGCGGFDISSFSKLPKPYLVYDEKGLHK